MRPPARQSRPPARQPKAPARGAAAARARRALPSLVAAAACAGLGGCGDKDLQQRVDRLEAELREVRSDTRDEVADLKTRVISAETQVGASRSGISLHDRVARLEYRIEQGLVGSGGDEMVYLRPHVRGHAPLRTDHGVFLVRLEGVDLNLESGGFTVHLNIGNPHAVAIEQFLLTGHHGGGTPELEEGEEYSLDNEKIRAWEESLVPFERRVDKTLEPFAWTSFGIELGADSREQLEMIRFRMEVENARLARPPAAAAPAGTGTAASAETGQYGMLRVGAESASVLRTDYGAFLVVVREAEESEVGTRLKLEIGNPYGFTINQSRLVGEFGPAPPRREEGDSSEEHLNRMQTWSAGLQPFESLISDTVSNFRWNEATILVPAPLDRVQFLRCQLRIEDVTLPAATER